MLAITIKYQNLKTSTHSIHSCAIKLSFVNRESIQTLLQTVTKFTEDSLKMTKSYSLGHIVHHREINVGPNFLSHAPF